MTKRQYVMLDRDGTIIVQHHHLSDPRQVELLPGAGEALRQLSNKGLGLVLVTNQSPIGRGLFNVQRLEQIHLRMNELLLSEGVGLDAVYYCPHTPADNCLCRKPQTGLVEQAARDLAFNPAEAFMIGDKLCDTELGRRVGATTLLVRTGYGAEEEKTGLVNADYLVDDLPAAANIICRLLRVPN